MIKNTHMEEDHVDGQYVTQNFNSEDYADERYVTEIITAEDYGNRHYVTDTTVIQQQPGDLEPVEEFNLTNR